MEITINEKRKSLIHFDYKMSLEEQLKSTCATMQKLLEIQSYGAVEAYNDIIARYHILIQHITTEMAGVDEAAFAKSRQEQEAEQGES